MFIIIYNNIRVYDITRLVAIHIAATNILNTRVSI